VKRKWVWILAWFAVLLLWNLAPRLSRKYPEYAEPNGSQLIFPQAALLPLEQLAHPISTKILAAIGDMTTPLEIVVSLAAISLIVISKRKPMAERQNPPKE
jgi:hypothetical protein